jgi:DMSO/TMAO reductase YedYZ molybdopterin-dependent catalytic subunit
MSRLSAPPGPFRPEFWRSPLRGPWLTSILGSVLLVLMTIVAVTGFASHAAYNPDLGANALVDPARDLPLTFDWPTTPAWLYAVNQGLHVNAGLVAVPILLAKLWSVAPHLFAWPPAATPARAIERLAVALLVSSAIFELATGVLNAQNWYPFGFGFVVAHYYGAVVFVAAIAAHLVVKLPVVLRAFRARGVLAPLRDDLAHTRPEPAGDILPVAPAEPTISRRGLLAFAGAGALAVLVAGVGQSVGGPLRRLAFLAPRRGGFGDRANDFAVNKTARTAGVTPAMAGPGWRLAVRGGTVELSLSRAALDALPQRTATLPIACVEGWSTTQTWTGVPLSELARRAGAPAGARLRVESLQPRGAFRQTTLSRDQVFDDRSLLALKVNGTNLSLDHGFPARIIVPALPGVHNTKWVAALTFEEAT